MKWNLLAVIFLSGCSSLAQKQNSDHIKCIEFSSVTRGYQELITITSDSLKFSCKQAGQQKIARASALKKSDWDELLNALNKVTLSEIPALKSPTMKRASDAARHSTITITTDSNQTFVHSFDDENPHEKLKALMRVILRKRGK
jgi:hypothetical protein